MGSMSWIHWLVFLGATAVLCATLYPGARILQRAGFSPWWVALCLIPGGVFVCYLLLAFVPWPALDERWTEA